MSITGVIHKFILDKLYGFALDSKGNQYFFHLGAFQKGSFKHQPPPILGEPVKIEISSSHASDINKAEKALEVQRLSSPEYLVGVIEYYDDLNTYGFIRDEDNKSYYLHKSEVLDRASPKKGQKVRFYVGINKGKPRACYVTILK